jgi:hypothetical protein
MCPRKVESTEGIPVMLCERKLLKARLAEGRALMQQLE